MQLAELVVGRAERVPRDPEQTAGRTRAGDLHRVSPCAFQPHELASVDQAAALIRHEVGLESHQRVSAAVSARRRSKRSELAAMTVQYVMLAYIGDTYPMSLRP